MVGLLVSAALSATPSASSAEAFAKAQQWEELYLAFAAVQPKGYGPQEVKRIAMALSKGCDALLATDAVMAFSLGEKSVAFVSQPASVVCTARAAIKTDQRSAAEEALREGLKRHRNDGLLSVALGSLLVDEKQGSAAVEVLSKVPHRSKQHAEAQGLLITARELMNEQTADRQRLPGQTPVKPAAPVARGPGGEDEGEREEAPASPVMGRGPPKLGTSMSYESSVDDEGRRIRQNAFFRFRYFNGQRDFGQRADYEGRVQGALEEARLAARNVMGVARDSAVDVILYSLAEFTMHHGPRMAQAVAGFYSESAIRMNDSAEINARNQATLVHEYVHAVIDELTGFRPQRGIPIWMNEGLAEYVEWQSLGRDGPEGRYAPLLRQMAAQKRLPTLESMRQDPLIATADPGLSYSFAAMAVRSFVKRWGMPELISLIRDVGKGTPFDTAFEHHTSTQLSRFEEGLADELGGR